MVELLELVVLNQRGQMALIDDLTTAVTNLENNVTLVETAVTDLVARAGDTIDPVAGEALVTRLQTASASLATAASSDPGPVTPPA